MHLRWRGARQIVRRLPLTLISLAVLGLVAVSTNSHVGELPQREGV